MKLKYLQVAMIAAFATMSTNAFAEHIALETIDVEGKRIEGSTTQPDINKAREEINKTAGGVTVVDMEQVREGRTSNFADTLGLATGVLAQSRFGAEETRLSIRGSGIQRTFHGRGIKLMQDGIPVNLADGSFDFPSIDPMATDYIEVHRGANALQYGSSNLGGSVNFISRTGYTAPKFEVRSEGGSYGYYRLGLSAGGVVDNLDYFVTASKYHSDSFRDNAQQSADRLTGNVGYKINENVETRFYVGYVNTDSQLPSNLTKQQLKDDPKQSAVVPGQGINERDINLTRIANKTTFTFDHTKVELGAFYSKKSLFHPIIDLVFLDTIGVIDQETDDYGLSVRLQHEGKFYGRDNTFTIGYAPTYGEVVYKNFRNVNASRGTLINQRNQIASNHEIFVEDRLNLTPDFALVAGLQYTNSRRKTVDKLITASGDQGFDARYNAYSPKLGVLYQLQPQVQLFANVSQSYEPPSFGELDNRVAGFIKAQKGTTFEVGSRGNSQYVDWDVALYQARLDNELLQVGIAGTTNASTTINADKTIHQGLELGLTARLPLSLELRGSYLVNNFKNDGDDVYKSSRLPGVQRQLLRSELLYRGNHFLHGFYFGPTIEWSPERYNVDFAEELYADNYFIWGLKAGQKVNDHWSWFLEGRNLANQKYAATTGVIPDSTRLNANQAQFSPGDGRTAYAGITWTY
ncbi:MAG: TonB-dependent receptor family protein [Methylophilaceae bacterium]